MTKIYHYSIRLIVGGLCKDFLLGNPHPPTNFFQQILIQPFAPVLLAAQEQS
ncbi:hypothetical protein MYAER_0491 [Microcystis aeruginosa NIES-2549]|uniref:Uncharacterized protein n=1 Tax=Microcystis aeruginosa NIES-2549 TaxID=1641812 RepID=A0A0F6U1H6_MICAE|nr:hypothetical protein MYAER_0491 [Microcystis aeruginosa NIES-2549]